MNDLVSIVTPVYNSKEFISDTINSVMEQSYENWELILVDDCSKDGSYEFIQENFDDERIKLYRNKENKGAGYSRNAAISKAKGKYLAFLDSDDLWTNEKLAKQITFMLENDAEISYTDFVFINSDSKEIRGASNIRTSLNLKKFMKTTEIGFSTSMIDISKTGKPRMAKIPARQDAAMWMSLLRKNYKAYGIKEVLAMYRVRDNQITSNKLDMIIKTFKVYIREKSFPVYKRVYYWLRYVFNAILKRFRKSN